MARYIIRALKYFLYLCIILFVFVTILVALKFVPKDVSQIFVNGYDSLWQIGLIVLAFSAVYPKVGYGKREFEIAGDPSELSGRVKSIMSAHKYEEVAPMVFRPTNYLTRASKMYEDKITITPCLGGFVLEGRTKDIIRACAWLSTGFSE